MSKRKDEVLRNLSEYNLRVLVQSVSDEPIGLYATRSDLTKLIKEKLSLEEINRKVNETRHGSYATERGAFASSALLKVGIVLVFATAFLDYIYFATSYYGLYPIYLAYNSAMVSVGMIRLVGLALIVYWFFSSALLTIGNNRAAGAALALGGAILIAAILISLSLLALGGSYYRSVPF